MNSRSIIALFLFFAIQLHAQKAIEKVAPYALEYHQNRLDAFKKETKVIGKIVFLGNSITEFGPWAKLLNDSTIINRGIAGDNTFGVLDRLNEIVDLKPKHLFIKIGINDIAQNTADEVIIKNILKILARIKKDSPHTLLYVHSLLPTNDAVKKEYPNAFGKNKHVVFVNTKLRQLAKKSGYRYVNIYPLFTDNSGKLLEQYADNDGLHLNMEGYKLWTNFLKSNNFIK